MARKSITIFGPKMYLLFTFTFITHSTFVDDQEQDIPVVVTRGNEIVGISRDLMPITSFVEGDESVESKGLSGIGYIMLARNVMNNPIVINKNTDLSEAAQIMCGKKISGIPVASSDKDLNGIITKTDIVRALIETDNNTGPHI